MSEPRSFKLLDEYDAAIGKAGKSLVVGRHSGLINYGANDDDIHLSTWTGVIIGIQGKQTGEFMYEFRVTVPPNYPSAPPKVRFVQPQIRMPCVDAQGNVDLGKLDPPFRWQPKLNIADVLMAIRDNMYSDKVNRESANLGQTSY